MSELQQIQKSVDTVCNNLAILQDLHKRNSDDFHKLTEENVKLSTEIQETNSKIKGLEEASKYLEKIVSRMPAPGAAASNAGMTAEEQKAQSELARYIRCGTALTPEIVKYTCNEIIHKAYKGGADENKELQLKALIGSVDPTGGYFVRPQLASFMIQRFFETSPIRQVANIVSIGTNTLLALVDDNEMSDGGWVGEVETPSDTNTAEIGEEAIPVYGLRARPKATQDMLDDAIFDVESWLVKRVVEKMTRTENTAFVTGNGNKKPKGFLQYSAWTTPGIYERGKIEQINSGSATDFTADGVIALQNSLLEEYQENAVFLMQRASFRNIQVLKDGVGRYLLNPNTMYEGNQLTMLGHRIIYASDMPSVAGNALPLIYGDFSIGYTIVDRIGIRLIRDNITSAPYVRFNVYKRVGGAVTNYQSLKIQKIAV